MKLVVKDLYKSFGKKQVLKGISFSVESGTALGLLGRNGAGKTTTIRILMDVFRCDAGTITIDGKPVDLKTLKFGYLPEERGLYPKKKIIDQLVYFAELKGLSRKEAYIVCDEWLKKLEMFEYRNKKLDTLSKGNQQKIQLITALVNDPDILFLDEPFSGLDPVNAMILESVVKEQIMKGKIVLFSSHQMNYIEEFCENIAILNEGKIVLFGRIHDIRRSYPRLDLLVRSEDLTPILTRFPDAERLSDNEMCIHMQEESEKKFLMKELTENFDIDEIKIKEPSIQDIFVSYTKEQEVTA